MANFENLRKSGLTYVLTKLKSYFVQLKDAVLSVNGEKPDSSGNVQINSVAYAENISSSSSQQSEGIFTFRTSGGTASVKNGDAWLLSVKGQSVHRGYSPEVLRLSVQPMPRSGEEQIITATIDRATFIEYVAASTTITLTYTTEWSDDPELYGITVVGTPIAGDQITVVYEREARGVITQSDPQTFVSTGWNLYNHATGYAKVTRYSDVYGYMIEGAYSQIQFSSTLSGQRVTITPQDGKFNVNGDGYIWVIDGDDATTAIWLTWSDWTEAHDGAFEAYHEAVVDLSSVMESVFPNGLLNVGSASDEINISSGVAISRVERLEYTEGNLADAIASGREYEYDENYIYLARAADIETTISLLGNYTATDHGTEYFTGTSCDVYALTVYGANLKNKLERDVITISPMSLTGAQKQNVRNSIGAAGSDAVWSVANGGTGATTAEGARENLGLSELLDQDDNVSLQWIAAADTYVDSSTRLCNFYRRGKLCLVNMNIRLKSGAFTSSVTLGTVPAGYRPIFTSRGIWLISPFASGDVAVNSRVQFAFETGGNFTMMHADGTAGFVRGTLVYVLE